MSRPVERVISFIRRHTLFSFFFVALLAGNFAVIGLATRETSGRCTCSSYNRGPLGTHALYTYLAGKGVPVSRMQQAPFEAFYKKEAAGHTLVMISPRIRPGAWEWSQLLAWVKRGNRLVTAGVFMPSRFFAGESEVNAWSRRVSKRPLRVALPVDTVFPYEVTLPPLPELAELLSPPVIPARDSSRIRTAVLSHLKAGMLPLLTSDTLVTAAKRIIGKGEWIMFAHGNPFANILLENERWFFFACRLLTGDPAYARASIVFDEYHNGYRATENLWAMVRYYRFDRAIFFGSLLMLLYLFFTGVRILPPRDPPEALSRDSIPGLRSMAGLFLKYRSFSGLLRREVRLVRRLFAGGGFENEPAPSRLALSYCGRKPLPPGVADAGELARLIERAERAGPSTPDKELVSLFNILQFMRKELKR